MFINREQAGSLLADELLIYKNNKDVVVVAIPRGGVPVGYEIAKKLNLPLEIVLSKKIGHPFNKEYAIGAVTLKSKSLNEFIEGVTAHYIESEIKRIREVLTNRYKLYYGDRIPMNLQNKTVIVVDDGVATGRTLLSSIDLIKKENPANIVVALPVSSIVAFNTINELPIVKETICLLTPKNFRAVGQFYKDFRQVSDEKVIQLLK
ncbi:phosphoribosyltransferase [uncultured Lutibacter sp.]|uniref:phosphoribosyltransferase n=1 Tax=Lutibacter sp. TaxID=1925666 RepID=UPI0026158D32|nr:phosphoribosyltransferase family protein [uncultured Lutibacter sp.]